LTFAKSLVPLNPENRKKLRFLVIGGLNTLVGLGVYPILYLCLHPIGLGYIQALILSQIFCITFSFVTNKYFVFQTKGNLKAEYLKFISFHGFYFLLNLAILPLLVQGLNMSPIIAQTLFSVVLIVTSYFWHNSITFSLSKKEVL
jgi:putative flippase GtrA